MVKPLHGSKTSGSSGDVNVVQFAGVTFERRAAAISRENLPGLISNKQQVIMLFVEYPDDVIQYHPQHDVAAQTEFLNNIELHGSPSDSDRRFGTTCQTRLGNIHKT